MTVLLSPFPKGISGTSYLLIVNRDDMSSVQVTATSGSTAWQRVQASYTNSGSTAITAKVQIYGVAGTQVYFDCVQVEKAEAASRYNLLENGDFSHSGSTIPGWTAYGLSSQEGVVALDASAAPELDTNVLKITGNPTGYKQIEAGLSCNGQAGDAYVLSGWAKGNSIPMNTWDGNPRQFAITITLHNH